MTVREPWYSRYSPDGHALLIVEPVEAQFGRDTDPAKWAQLTFDALQVEGILARILVDVLGALDATRADHGCRRVLWRDDPKDGEFEVVDAEWDARGGRSYCDGYLAHYPDDHILDEGRMPELVVCVPVNRVRGWTARLARAIAEITDSDLRSISTAPSFTDDEGILDE